MRAGSDTVKSGHFYTWNHLLLHHISLSQLQGIRLFICQEVILFIQDKGSVKDLSQSKFRIA